MMKKTKLTDTIMSKKQNDIQLEWGRLHAFLDKMEVKIKARAATHIKKRVLETPPAPFIIESVLEPLQSHERSDVSKKTDTSCADQIERLLDLIKKQLIAENTRQKKLASRKLCTALSTKKPWKGKEK